MSSKGRHWRTSVEILEQWDREGLIEWSSSGNPRKIVYADEKIAKGKRIQDALTFKDPPYPLYPTQKNRELPDRIIRTSSNPGSTVLDCFCGSGTTPESAQAHGRFWVGVDNSGLAVEITINRLKNAFSSGVDYGFVRLD